MRYTILKKHNVTIHEKLLLDVSLYCVRSIVYRSVARSIACRCRLAWFASNLI